MTQIKKVKTSDGTVIPIDHSEGPDEPEQLHTKMTLQATQALYGVMARRKLSKTDAANRTMSLGGFIDHKLAEGYEIALRKNGETETVHIV